MPLRRQRRQPHSGRGRLQTRASLPQWPLGLQLLHVPRRHGSGGHLGRGAGGYQRHEPILPQRAQRQQRHSGGHLPEQDYPGHPLAGIELQRALESAAFSLGGATYNAPAQRVGDFLAGRPSSNLGAVKPSYTPGITLTDLSAVLPAYAIVALREAIPPLTAKSKASPTPTPC